MFAARDYQIALAELKDIPHLSSIEKAAATLLKGHAPDSALEDTTAEAEFHAAQMDGRLWVARTNDLPVGFAHAEMLEPTSAHLKELDVHPEHIRRGLGSRLVMAVCAWARATGCQSLTLTTFREVPFNKPFYAQLGFEVIPTAGLSSTLRSIIQEESRRGLDPSRRVAMRYRFARNETLGIAQERIEAVNCSNPLFAFQERKLI
jgi:GNAT superfamily N-acetyltransferase